ncbi:Fic family protein [Lamprobacter modestohalophilus]|uniref:Fic family protein n=1 Tax=Lamprobacter modestohalophilus TaxID=1064514 RepID=UPI002ADEC874|nr:Fic family protein [Lamprobacter modestohalophilus]MEA1049084.1 Fic family protein [Lamprobacter modestohalophilus]
MTISKLKALQGLDHDLQQSLLNQIRDLWTHSSTALEGNTLTLGETKFVIEEGLTVSGKPLKHHQEVMGHARAIALIYHSLEAPITAAHLFDLHRAIQSEIVTDIYKPYGAWKREPNGTYAVTDDGRQTFIEYAAPEEVPALMTEWLAELNRLAAEPLSETTAIDAYAKLHLGFVHVHPFWDGNGRLARLLSNIPVLRSGYLPVVIELHDRKNYIDLLARYELAIGPVTAETGVWPAEAQEAPFLAFCQRSYQVTRILIEQAKYQQAKRHRKHNSGDVR